MSLLIPPGEKLQYRATGFIRGIYIPLGQDCFGKGSLKTEDGLIFPCLLTKNSATFFQKNPSKLMELSVFNAWVRTQSDGNLRFQIKNSVSSDKFAKAVDLFSIRGKIIKILESAIVIRIKRNCSPPKGKEKAWQYKPFVVVLHTTLDSPLLNSKFLGQFWEFQVSRKHETTQLIIENCSFVAEASKKTKALAGKPTVGKQETDKPKPILKSAKKVKTAV